MKRELSLILCGLSFSMGAFAAQLTPEQALQRLDTPGMRKIGNINAHPRQLLYTADTENGEPAVYVFHKSNNSGYLIVSADDAVAPLLGYADSGEFDPENMPEPMKWWLEEYGRQIEYARANNLPAYVSARNEERKPVAPLIKTRWNQNIPFNDMTPLIGSANAPTGCVATAMAQVMKYWNYPEQATGTGMITNPATGDKETMILGEEPFDWKNMLDSYIDDDYTDKEAHAVAYLMKACGYAVNMRYNRYSSGAVSYNAGVALINNFGYNPELQYCVRNYTSPADWEDMIYNEVANGRPVLYGGQSPSVGHEFVCDGYSSDGYFHFNWGWSGMSDGYFLLDSLNPNALGTGGGEGGGYNYAQDILVGVQPEKERVVEPNLVQFGALSAKTSGLNMTFTLTENGRQTNWFNVGLSDVNVTLGLSIESLDSDQATEYLSVTTGKIEKPIVTSTANGTSMQFAGMVGNIDKKFPAYLDDGRYKVTVVTKAYGNDFWIPVNTLQQYYNYVYITKSGTSLTVENLPDAMLTLDSAELTSKLYYGCVAKMSIKVTNNSEKELTGGFYPQLSLNGASQMMGDGLVLTVPANTTVTEEFYTTFRLVNGASAPSSQTQYTLEWFDPVYDSSYPRRYSLSEDVVMKIVTGSPSITVDKFEIANATLEDSNYGPMYMVEGSEVDFELGLTNTRGYFSYPLSLEIFPFPSGGYSVASAVFEPFVILEAKESAEVSAKVNLSHLKTGTTYMAFLYYEDAKGSQELSDEDVVLFQLTEDSGVEIVAGDENVPVEYFNLQGQKVTNPQSGMILIRKQGSKTQKIIF